MINRKPLNDSLAAVKKAFPKAKPTLGMILGSGLSDIAESFTPLGVLSYEKIPGLGKAGVAGHAGRLVWGKSAGIETFIFQGRRHVYEGVGWEAVATPLFLLKSLGAKAVFLTNAAGGTNPKWKPGDLMIIDDHINLMGVTPLLGKHDPFWGPRFPDQSFIYDRKLRAALSRAGKKAKVALRHGVYFAGTGPTYETPAEVRAWRTLGADAVGMSTAPEVIVAAHCGMKVLGISCITNMAAGILHHAPNHKEVLEVGKRAQQKFVLLLKEILGEI